MLKNLYGNKRKNLYSEGHKAKYIYIKIKKDNDSKNNKGNDIYLEELNSNKLIEEKNNNKNDGYIYYGNNKIFKTKNLNYSSQNISNELKTQNLFFRNNKHPIRNLSINKDNIINNNYNIVHKFQKQSARNIVQTKYFILLL